ncbi:MAG: iron ABC transporter permease, partial [Brevundimonas sp.]
GQYVQAVTDPGSPAGQVLWLVRAPRAVCAAAVGAALGLSGAVMQGLLRNPLADPGVLGVSATSALAAALGIVLGLAAIPGAVEALALVGAGGGGLLLIAFAARVAGPEALILFGVALSSFAGAVTALIFNLSPSPVASAEVMNWLLGSVQNRGWNDVHWAALPMLAAAALASLARPGLRMLTLGEEAAATSGLPMRRLRLLALAAAALSAGGAVAAAGIIGFVGLAAPHLVRAAVRGDPGRLLAPSALAGALMLVVADVLARVTPTDQELKLGVFTALVGAPLFALIAWRAAREWRP